MASEKFPTEVWEQIFQHLQNSDLRQCRAVNRYWATMSQKFYKPKLHLVLQSQTGTADAFLTLVRFPELAHNIRTLGVYYEIPVTIFGDRGRKSFKALKTWKQVVKRCTNLQELYLYVKNPYYFLQELQKVPQLHLLQEINLLPYKSFSPACLRYLDACRNKHTNSGTESLFERLSLA